MKLHFKIELFEARLAIDEDLDDEDLDDEAEEEKEHDEDCACAECDLPRVRRYLQSEVESRKQIREALAKAEMDLDVAKRELREEQERLRTWKRDADAADRKAISNRLANGEELNRLREENARLRQEAKTATGTAMAASLVASISREALRDAAERGAIDPGDAALDLLPEAAACARLTLEGTPCPNRAKRDGLCGVHLRSTPEAPANGASTPV